MKPSKIMSGLLIAATLLAVGCVERTVYHGRDGDEVEYTEVMPAPRVEVQLPAPDFPSVWVPGIWVHEGPHWHWHHGYYRHR